jgi:hypothetical protein
MAIRSHVDLCFFVRFVHMRRDQIPDTVLQTLLNKDRASREELSAAWVQQMSSTTQITFHESYHFWQGLRLPFLHRYAFLSLRVIWQGFKELSKQIPKLDDWDCILPDLYRLTLNDNVWLTRDRQIALTRDRVVNDVLLGPVPLNPLDLLEGAASLAEFQVHTLRSELTDYKTFSRWAKRNPAYLEAFRFTLTYLEDEVLTLRSFLPLVNAAFHTTEPVRAFCSLLATLKSNVASGVMNEWLSQSEPIRWDDLCSDFLNHIKFDAAPDSDGRLLGSPFHRLTLNNWVFNRTIDHPFLTAPARKWCHVQKDDPVHGWLLSQPGWATDKVLNAIVHFAPTVSFVRFHVDGQNDRIIVTGEPPTHVPLVDLMTLYSVVRRASGSHYDPESRLCHHKSCPDYGPNFCNCFPKVPTAYENCEFRQRVEALRQLEVFV